MKKRNKKRKGRASITKRFQYLKHKLVDDIKTQDLRILVKKIRETEDFHKLDLYVLISNGLAKERWPQRKSLRWIKKIRNTAYKVKYISLLTLYEKYPDQVRIDSDSKQLIFCYQAGGLPQGYHFPISHLKESFRIGRFNIQMLPEAIRELI